MWNVLFSLLFIAWLALPDSVNLRLCICWRSLAPRSKLGNCGIFAQTSFVLNVSGSMMSSQAMTWINHNWQWTGLNYVIAWPLREYADTHRDKISNINAWLLKSAKREIETWLNCANFIQWHCQVLNVDNGFFEHVIVEIMVHQRATKLQSVPGLWPECRPEIRRVSIIWPQLWLWNLGPNCSQTSDGLTVLSVGYSCQLFVVVVRFSCCH